VGPPILDAKHADPAALIDRRAAVIGYGNQGRAHALNLRDSGVAVIVGQRDGKSAATARADGFDPVSAGQAAAQSDIVILTLPDESAADVYAREIVPSLRRGATLGFVHGFNIRFGFIQPPEDTDVIMIAPKGPGTLLRSLYLEGKGLPALMAVHRDASNTARRTALAWAAAIGSLRAGVIETTFADETETDLFGEQVVLCGGVVELARAAFDTLVEAGYEPAFAYLECVHELKQVVDLLYARGLTGMHERISNTAEYGALTRGPRLIQAHARAEMKRILEEVRGGSFAKEWIEEHRRGGANFKRMHQAETGTLFDQTGKYVRSLMPWLQGDEKVRSNT